MVVAEGLTALLFPFRWPHTYVSVLPYDTATHFFDAPVPYIIGVLVKGNENGLLKQALEVSTAVAKNFLKPSLWRHVKIRCLAAIFVRLVVR